jgi:hypothetical protein
MADEEYSVDDFGMVLWRTLVALKRVCVQMRLPEHARVVGNILDELEDMMGDDDGTKDDERIQEAREKDHELAGRPDVPRGKPSE